MDSIEKNLANWQASLVENVPLGGLFARNPTVYKWKAPFRCWLLREGSFWRTTDLLTQSLWLHQQGHALGARILLRSCFETLAMLIYVNLLIRKVISGEIEFHSFSEKTSILLLGSRDDSTGHQALNIVSILDKCDKRYPGIKKLYAGLSESAHPNYEGIVTGYSRVDHDEYDTRFWNRWGEIYGSAHLDKMELCMTTFHLEYDEVWPGLMDKLESWIAENDEMLETSANSGLRI
ncbi:hypothetical protein [Phaeobacter sp. S60]|uniref:hypothetical protein n=1 Tax=Phaeobacter sp. S60 TaxID=1569353 RepID=UPI00058BA80E|nr:hypothetical protein [Phaeobacter sp. S60]KII16146.1 hypothetical protein OO25_07770 [Phaeobacter sp. S60]